MLVSEKVIDQNMLEGYKLEEQHFLEAN